MRRQVGDLLAHGSCQSTAHGVVALGHGHQRIRRTVRIGEGGAIAQRGARGTCASEAVAACVLPRQCDVTATGLAFAVEIFQGELGAIGVVENQIVTRLFGNHVIQQLFFTRFRFLQNTVILARLGLDGVGPARVEGLRGFAVVKGDGMGVFRRRYHVSH